MRTTPLPVVCLLCISAPGSTQARAFGVDPQECKQLLGHVANKLPADHGDVACVALDGGRSRVPLTSLAPGVGPVAIPTVFVDDGLSKAEIKKSSSSAAPSAPPAKPQTRAGDRDALLKAARRFER
jgi:hypothetical protein